MRSEIHPEIIEIINTIDPDVFFHYNIIFQNANRLLNYIEDINLERTGKFELTPDESLYLLWNVEEWDFHMECLKNGRILFTFRKSGYGKTFGSFTIDEFIPLLERYLLMEFS
ncbi:MAG: hypothetical protein JWQ63_4409 [Mucilaginibacter sp.]|nr:hypothetical protein [Mucilaginibacter sp.]